MVLFLFGGVVAFFLRGIIFKPGTILGSDWSLPLTSLQMQVFGRQALYTWMQSFNLLGARLGHLNTYPFNLIFLLLAKLNIGGGVVTKVLLLSLLVLIPLSAYWFCRQLKIGRASSLVAGFWYLTTPLVFNYAIMGWIFVLIFLALVPIFLRFFWRSVERGKFSDAVVAGLAFSLALFQSQAIFWFPLMMVVSFPFLVRSKEQFWFFIRSSLAVVVLVSLVHANWILPLILAPDSEIFRAVSTYDIGRFESRLNMANLVRLWGGLFNYQFETVYPEPLLLLSFSLPLLSLWGVWVNRRKRHLWVLVLIAALPLVVFLGRGVIYNLPFGTVLRDVGRMMVLAALPYAVLGGLGLSRFQRVVSQHSSFLFGLFIACLWVVLSSWPFWTGEWFGSPREYADSRLRVLSFPEDYREAEEFLSEDATDTRVLYLPAGQLLGLHDYRDFLGPHREAVDLFALLSPQPGAFAFSDKTQGLAVDYGRAINKAFTAGDLATAETLLGVSPIRRLVVRRNVYSSTGEGGYLNEQVRKLSETVNVWEEEKVSVYERANFLPHLYIPEKLVAVSDDYDELLATLAFYGGEDRPAVLAVPLTSEEVLAAVEEDLSLFRPMNNVPLESLDPEWEKGWAWPEANLSPRSRFYILVRWREARSLRNAVDSLSRSDVLLWQGTKRVAELAKFTNLSAAGKQELVDVYLEAIEEATAVLQEIPNREWDKNYWGLVGKTLAYTNRAEEVLSESFEGESLTSVKVSHQGFRDWVVEAMGTSCGSSYCFHLEVTPGLEYDLFLSGGEGGTPLTGEGIGILSPEAGEWVSFGSTRFDSSWPQLTYDLPESANLIEVGDLSGALSFSSEISGWRPGEKYVISFDYLINDGQSRLAGRPSDTTLTLALLEKRPGWGEEESSWENSVLIKRGLSTEDIKWHRFRQSVQSSFDAESARLYLYATPADKFAAVSFRNLAVTHQPEPLLVLRQKKDLADEESSISSTPKLTFIRVNPTRYRVRIEGATKPYLLVFNESFHSGWKLSLADEARDYGLEVASYFEGQVAEGTHRNTFWERGSFGGGGENLLAEGRHQSANGYANSWLITPEDVDGARNYELVVEFWPQRYYNWGFLLGIVTLIGGIAYLLTGHRVSLFNKEGGS